jgi:hypothetical protein
LAYASRQANYLLGSVGAFLQVFAGWWDVFSHITFGNVDPWWNPAHITLYFGVGLVIIAVWRGLRVSTPQAALVSPIRFVNTGGMKLAGLGATMQIIAGIWNEIVHHMYLHEPSIAPAHALLTLGMLTISLGMVVGLSIEYGMVKQRILVASASRKRAIAFCIILMFASIWLAGAGSLIYIAGVIQNASIRLAIATILSVLVSLVEVPAKKVLAWFGSVLVVGIIFNGVSYIFLILYGGLPIYVPLGLLPLLVFEILVSILSLRMKPSTSIVASASAMGLLFYATYYPFTVYLFLSAHSLPLQIAVVTLGSFVGALLGNLVYDGLSALVLRGAR